MPAIQVDWLQMASVAALIVIFGAVSLFVLLRMTNPYHKVMSTAPRSEPKQTHVHNWQDMATEWNAGREVHIMVCWQHDKPVIERREATS